MKTKLAAGLVVALLGIGVALANYYGWLGAADLEREQAEARRALREEAEALEAKKRAFAEAQREEQERREKERQEQEQRARGLWPEDVPLSTLGCEEAHRKLAKEEPVAIDPDVERSIKGRLSRGTYLRDCDVPSRTQVLICAAILEGRAEGVTVKLTPPDDEDRACVDRFVRRMRFPPCDELLVATTHFR